LGPKASTTCAVTLPAFLSSPFFVVTDNIPSVAGRGGRIVESRHDLRGRYGIPPSRLKLETASAISHFYLLRIARIWPAHVTTLLLAMALLQLPIKPSLIPNALLLQSWIP
jgi:hypothetical protein